MLTDNNNAPASSGVQSRVNWCGQILFECRRGGRYFGILPEGRRKLYRVNACPFEIFLIMNDTLTTLNTTQIPHRSKSFDSGSNNATTGSSLTDF